MIVKSHTSTTGETEEAGTWNSTLNTVLSKLLPNLATVSLLLFVSIDNWFWVLLSKLV